MSITLSQLESHLWESDAVAATATTALPDALAGWLQSSIDVRRSIDKLLNGGSQ